MDEGITFSAEEAVAVQRALRSVLGLGPEAFPLQAFVGMISDEIEQFRAAGRTDDDVADLVTRVTGRPISSADIARWYAPPQARAWGDDGG